MKVYLGDLAHNYVAGANTLSGEVDYTVPLNIAYIAAYAKKVFRDEAEITLFKYPGDLLKAIDASPPDVLGLSHYGWNANLDIEIAQYVKKYYGDVLTVLGGPAMRITEKDYEIFLRKNRSIDALVLFEGERPFADILMYVKEHGTHLDKECPTLGSVAYLAHDKFHYTPASEKSDLEDFDSPYLTGLLDPFLKQGLIPLFESNRGCPFTCTFCAWGISAMSKVRKFSLDRIEAEFNYVNSKFPLSRIWIVADANFGMLKRDVDIARMLRKCKESNPKLESFLLWDSKNTFERNAEIAEILTPFSDDAVRGTRDMTLMALQHLNPRVLENIKRSNIKLGNVPERVKEVQKRGRKVTTDLLFALPGESLEDAIDNLRKAFEYNFDFVSWARTMMLPGSEIEMDETRQKFGLRTKFMIRKGSCGVYPAKHETIKSIEFDEMIVGSDVMTESEWLFCTQLQFLVFLCWNHGQMTPLLRYLRDKCALNPVDVLLRILTGDKNNYPRIDNLFRDFRREIENSMFESPQAARQFYEEEKNWNALLEYIRVELKYNGVLLGVREIHEEFFSYIESILSELNGDKTFREIIGYLKGNFVDVQKLFTEKVLSDPTLTLGGAALKYISPDLNNVDPEKNYLVKLTKSEKDKAIIKAILEKENFSKHPISALERLLGVNIQALRYKCELVDSFGEHRAQRGSIG